MAELYLVRHGQASFGAENYDALSACGRTQSLWLGEHFAQRDVPFDRVVIGTMQRHRQTVDAILEGMGNPRIEIEQDADLNEYDFHALFAALGDKGLLPGWSVGQASATSAASKKDFYKALRQVLQLWADDRLPGRVPETWLQFQTRVQRALTSIQRGIGRRVLVVSSGGPMAVIAQQVLRAPAATAIALNMQIRNSSVCQYVFKDSAMSLVSFNSVPHLECAGRHEFVTHG